MYVNEGNHRLPRCAAHPGSRLSLSRPDHRPFHLRCPRLSLSLFSRHAVQRQVISPFIRVCVPRTLAQYKTNMYATLADTRHRNRNHTSRVLFVPYPFIQSLDGSVVTASCLALPMLYMHLSACAITTNLAISLFTGQRTPIGYPERYTRWSRYFNIVYSLFSSQCRSAEGF